MKINIKFPILFVILLLYIEISAQKEVSISTDTLIKENIFDIPVASDPIIVFSIININNKQEISELDDLAANYQSSNVLFIAITDEVSDCVVNRLKYQLSRYIYLSEEENERIFNKYQTGVFKIFPLHVITNKKDEVFYMKKGNIRNIKTKLSRKIDKILLNKNFRNEAI